MPEKDQLISQMLFIAEQVGLTGITPAELSHAGNLIIHLAPYPIVARIATVMSKEDAENACKILERELRVARHLHSNKVPVLLPADLPNTGPYDIGGTWMTLWKYVPSVQLESPSIPEAIELVNRLSEAMKDFDDELPVLGVWERTCQSADRLSEHSDRNIQALLDMFWRVDKQMRLEPAILIPCHGDAHRRNLIPSAEGWIWSDFEDVSLMPAYWDLASFVANLALFGGIQEPTFRFILDLLGNDTDLQAFGIAMTARILMSTLGNLDFALAGHGDLEFATNQLKRSKDFIRQLDLIIAGNRVRLRD